MSAVDQTAFIEDRVFSKLFSMLNKDGWKPVAVDSGDADDETGGWVQVDSVKKAKDEFMSVDMATIRVKKGTRTHGILLIAGNGIDLVSDFTIAREGHEDGFEELMIRIQDEIEEKYG